MAQQTCFVIMPFSKTSRDRTERYWSDHFSEYLTPAIEAVDDVKAVRSEPLRADVIQEIINSLITAPIVVADLTDANPNVFWELGIRQSFKHGTITIAQTNARIPFDVSTKAVLRYHPDNHLKDAAFRRQLARAIKDCIDHPMSPDSRVLDSVGGRGSLYQLVHHDEIRRRISALDAELAINSELWLSIGRNVEANKNRKPILVSAARPLTSCVELLVTSRYLDQEPSFYDAANKYLSFLLSLNNTMMSWLTQPKQFEAWFEHARFCEISEKYEGHIKEVVP